MKYLKWDNDYCISYVWCGVEKLFIICWCDSGLDEKF